jgi:hypothetical protein
MLGEEAGAAAMLNASRKTGRRCPAPPDSGPKGRVRAAQTIEKAPNSL